MVKKALLIIVALTALLIATLLFVTFDSPELGRKILAQASAASGVNLTAESFELNLWRGVVLKGLRAESSFPGGKYVIELEEMLCEHRLLPLLSGRVAIDRVLLVSPSIEVVEGQAIDDGAEAQSRSAEQGVSGAVDDEAPEQGELSDSGGELELEISEVVLTDAAIVFRDTQRVQLGIAGFDLTLRDLSLTPGALTALHGLMAEGSFDIERVSFDAMALEGFEGRLGMQNGEFTLQDMSFQAPQGSFEATLDLNFNHFPVSYSMTLLGDPIDVNRLAGSTADQGTGYGPATLEMEARGVGVDPQNLKATGVLHLSEGSLPSSGAFSAMEATLGRTNLVGAPYAATDVPFRVEDHRLYIEKMNLLSPQVGLDATGVVDLSGPLDFAVVMKTPRADLKIKEVRDEILDLLTDSDGFVSIPYRVAGTIDEPKVAVDAGSLSRQARQNTGRVAKEKILEGIGGLFGRRRKN